MLKIETDGKAVIKKFSDYDFLSEYHKKLIKEEHNEKDFSSIEKHVIIIPKNQKANVKINYNIESSQFSHIIIILEENSTAEITETLESSEASKLNTALTEIFLKENSQLEFISAQNLSSNINNKTIKRAEVSRNAKINWNTCLLGSLTTKMEASSILIGEGAESYNYGVFLAHKEENFHIGSSTIHKAPNTNSDILVKGIVKDKAKALYDGLVHIDRIAQNCNAYQHEDALILNEGAHADSIPTLTIDNKEVKCSHGSTISQVDKEKLFYLKTRGLNEASATRVIIEGFFEPIVQKMKGISQLKENILARIK